MGAVLSSDRRYRYVLTRDVAPLDGVGTVAFVGLNPSTADEMADDPTIRRCIGFARRWGYARLVMLNLYGLRATDPGELPRSADPVGPENAETLGREAVLADLVVAAWGTKGGHMAETFVHLLGPRDLRCLGKTKDGHPRHPLYVRADQPPVPFP